jgi:hypothetical protein
VNLDFKINDKATVIVIQGEDVTLTVDLMVPGSSVAYALSGFSTVVARFQNADNTYLTVTGTVSSTVPGRVAFVLTHAQTAGLALQTAAEIELTLTAGSLISVVPLYYPLVVTAPMATVTGTALRRYLNVRDYGAVGDGGTDDTLAIQAALDDVGIVGSCEVVFPAGTYLISAPLVPKDNTTLTGEGYGSTLTVATVINSAVGKGFLQATDIQNLSVYRLRFLGTGVWTSTPFANPYASGNSVGFTNDDYGIRVNVSGGANGITIKDCLFEGLSRGISINPNGSGRFVRNVTIENNRFKTMGFGGIFLYQTRNFTIADNHIEQVYGNITAAGDTTLANSKFGDVIGLNSCTDGVVANNTGYDYQRTGLIVEPYGNPAGNATRVSGNATLTAVSAALVTILNELLAENQTIGIVGTGIPSGTTVDSASGTSVVMSAQASASGTSSIEYVVYSSRIVLNANTMQYQHDGRGSQDWTGIYIADGFISQPMIVANNSVFDIFGESATFAASSNGDGIVAEGCQVTGNNVKNCGAHGLSDVGGENSFYGNRVSNCGQCGLRVIHNEAGNLSAENNEFSNCGFGGITLGSINNSFIRIRNNLIRDCGGSTTPLGAGHEGLGLSGILIAGATSTELLQIEGNTFISSASLTDTVGQLYGISVFVNSDFNESIRNNRFIFTDASVKNIPAALGATPCCFATYFSNGGYTKYDLLHLGNSHNKNAWTNDPNWIGAYAVGYPRCLGFASVAPTTGTFRTGDYFLNSGIASSQGLVFMCIAGGTPGTWQSWAGALGVTPWQAYDAMTGPSMVNGPSIVTFADASWRRVGDTLHARGRVTAGASDGNSSRLEITVIPTGLTMKSTGAFTDLLGTVGGGKFFKSGSGAYPTEWLIRNTGTICPQPSWTVNGVLASNFLTNDHYTWDVQIPITGW